MSATVCDIGKVDDGTLRLCCSSHNKMLCAHHYARTHFVVTAPEYDGPSCREKFGVALPESAKEPQ